MKTPIWVPHSYHTKKFHVPKCLHPFPHVRSRIATLHCDLAQLNMIITLTVEKSKRLRKKKYTFNLDYGIHWCYFYRPWLEFLVWVKVRLQLWQRFDLKELWRRLDPYSFWVNGFGSNNICNILKCFEVWTMFYLSFNKYNQILHGKTFC